MSSGGPTTFKKEPGVWGRIVLHADMDAFYAAVEQRDNPSLRGKAVLVGGRNRRGVVLTASYEARKYKVGSAMPMAEAMRRCPHAIVVPPRFEHYQAASHEIMEVFGHFSPSVEAISLDEAFMDMTGSAHLFGGPRSMGDAIRAEVKAVTALTVSIGAANTKFLAKVASDFDKPDGLTVVEPERVAAFLHPLPIRALWGVGPKTAPRLYRLGLHSIGDVARADPQWLESELGGLGRHIYRLSHNRDPRAVKRSRVSKSVGSEATLGEDVLGFGAIRPHLLSAAERVSARLRRHGLRAGAVRVKLKTRQFEVHTRQMRLPRPTDDGPTLYHAATDLLSRFDLSEPMRLVGLTGIDIMAKGTLVQGELFADLAPGERLNPAIDGIRDKFGRHSVHRANAIRRAPTPADLG